MSIILKLKYYGYHVMSRKFGLVILRLFAKNHAFQNLMYLANITVLQNIVISDWYINWYIAKLEMLGRRASPLG